MPGTVFRGSSSEPAAIWKDGKLVDKDGVGTLLRRQGSDWYSGKAATVSWRQQGNAWFRGASSEVYWRLVQGHVLKGNTYDVLYRVVGDSLVRPNGRDVVLRGPGLTAEELITAALALEPQG